MESVGHLPQSRAPSILSSFSAPSRAPALLLVEALSPAYTGLSIRMGEKMRGEAEECVVYFGRHGRRPRTRSVPSHRDS
jgi:hypothetical protein